MVHLHIPDKVHELQILNVPKNSLIDKLGPSTYSKLHEQKCGGDFRHFVVLSRKKNKI
jgi:hypothetical protein